MASFTYGGDELDIFSHAVNWKQYLRRVIAPYINGDVAEVGAGLGGTTRVFGKVAHRSWTCVEPDPHLADRLRHNIGDVPDARVIVGTLENLPGGSTFDTCLYIDVLEHIEDDTAELRRATARLRPNGKIVVLSPAHQWLYSPFDKQIGHFRRYNRAMLERLQVSGLALERVAYLDSTGLLLSSANRLLLRSSSPTLSQVVLWDRWFIAASRLIDPIFRYRLGKSILGVWRKT